MRPFHFVLIFALTVACAVGGYFVGREHVKYELREAMRQLPERIAAIQAPPPAANPAPAPRAPALIGATLGSKTFHQSNPGAGDFQDAIQFSIMFENKSGKDIRAYDGLVTFTD